MGVLYLPRSGRQSGMFSYAKHLNPCPHWHILGVIQV